MDAFALVLLIPVAFGLFALAIAQYSRRKMRRSGTNVEAEVDEVVTALLGAKPSGRTMPVYYVKYRYLDASGVEHRGTSEALSADPTPSIVGGKALIAYDERHPDRSAWIGR